MQRSCWPFVRLHLLREPSAANERQWAELSCTLTDRTGPTETTDAIIKILIIVIDRVDSSQTDLCVPAVSV